MPTRVQGLVEKRITKVSCGAQHTLALTDDKQVWAFGSGIYGECGQGDLRNLLTPRQIELPKMKNKAYQQDLLMKELLREVDNRLQEFATENAPVIDIAAGGKHSLVLTGNGTLYTFGFGGQG